MTAKILIEKFLLVSVHNVLVAHQGRLLQRILKFSMNGTLSRMPCVAELHTAYKLPKLVRIHVNGSCLMRQHGVGEFDCHARFQRDAGTHTDARIMAAFFELKIDFF
ncbi:hypothetical protein LF1_26780 [Rubripirellula obstinata]|uniref:Uncharacterized protein n=1 Tax=Rubripirellula obstinata TaxID=406547 RepID=A0A5B1CK72_9BACT|nr:hypothetical protein LF1_26780 [Rubripirellula obstinata]